MLKIIQIPNPILRTKTAPIKTVDKKLLKFIKELKETLKKQHEPQGLGISANQAGADYRLFLAIVNKKKLRVFINPDIVEFSAKKSKITEGCLSVAGLYSEIERPEKIKLRYQTIEDNNLRVLSSKAVEDFTGLTARIMQHEVDHLNGIVFIDLALRQGKPIYKLVKGKDGKDEFEEIKI